ncbi:MAG: EF-hand domain-containing protein [Ekhidna sp.]
MLSELQRQKISHYFKVVLDQDRNGVLDENDFKEIGESLCLLWIFKPDSDEYNKVMSSCLKSWEMFKTYFNTQNAVANGDQFLNFCDSMISNEDKTLYREFVSLMIGSIFDSFDLNDDGVISSDEYTDMFLCYHIPIKHSAKAFVKLDRDGSGNVTKSELMEGVDEFFLSSDPKSRGNWLFGFWADR